MKFIIDKGNKIKLIKGTDEENWDLLINETKPKETELKNVTLGAAEEMKNNINDEQLSEGVKQNNTKKIEGAIPFELFDNKMEKIGLFLIAAYLYGALNAKKTGPKKIKDLDLSLNVQDPETLKFIKERTGDLIKEISGETKNAVREIIKRTYKDGIGPDAAAKQIKNIVGLTTRQALAVENYYTKLLADGIKPTTAADKAKAYSKRLIDFRAETIARTELMRSMNEGHQAFISEAIKRDLLDENEWEKVWWTAKDERVCPLCGPLHGETVGAKDTFTTPNGQLMAGPLHPRCRCVVLFKPIREGKK